MNTIEEKLNDARKELLDLSFRNPLINFKLRKVSGIGVYNINIGEVYDYLVNEGKTSIFTKEVSNNPARLYTGLDEKSIHNRLTKTYRQNRLFVEEKGANVLFLALGFLKWCEPLFPNTFYLSPLILVPTEIKKAVGSDRYSLAYSQEDVRFNISIITKMNQDYGINLDYDNDEIDIEKYLYLVNSKIDSKRQLGWEVVDDKGALDFFSYAKYLMYLDLDIEKWKKNGKFINENIMNKLFFTGFNDKLTKDDADINKIESPKNFYHVVDADSSQALAIHDVNLGKNMVMQGPPGTGKSQTITNLIASSIAMNKSVLFVSEKKAALEVVKRRLERVGLGDLVLEIHSDKANKLDVLKSIQKTLNLGEPKVNDQSQLYEKYNSTKEELNDYMQLVNKPILNSSFSLVSIYGEALKLKDSLDNENVRIPRVDFDSVEMWSNDDFKKRLDLTSELVCFLNTVGKIEKHPLYGSELMSCLPYEQVSLKERIGDVDNTLNSLIKTVNDIGSIIGNRANTIFDSKRFSDSINYIKDFGSIDGLNSADYRYSENPDMIKDIVNKGIKIRNFYEENLRVYNEKAFKDPKFEQLYEQYEDLGVFKGKEKNELLEKMKSLYIDEEYKGNNYKQLFKELYKQRRSYKYFRDNKTIIKQIFGEAYKGMFTTNWNKIKIDIQKVIELHREINNYKIVSQMKLLVMDDNKIEKLTSLNENFINDLKEFIISLDKFMDSSNYNEIKRFGYEKWYLDMSFYELKKVVSLWNNNIDRIVEVVRYNELEKKMYEYKLDPILDLSYEWKGKYDNFTDILRFEYFDALINEAYNKYPRLQEFKKYKADKEVELFKELDITIMIENIKSILDIHWKNMPKLNDELPDMATLRREFQKKRNQMPIRKLMSKVGSTMQKIKPVFMMSPLSVASYLTPGDMTFDLVVFDEASQVRPVEAFGALFRARQIVVVGDSKQLPPTTFFDTMTNKYDELVDEDYDISNMESILSLLLSRNIPQRTLNWHYRSRHQSLIMLSNREFYNSELKIFPSANDLDMNEGLVFKYYPNTAYQRGGSRSNPKESRYVIERVFEIIEKNPDLSIGVVSFSMAQQEELYKEFEKQIKKRENPQINKYFASHDDEPFFIKNLENVQGDERDVILISIGYGYDEEHHLTMDFGPLNKDGGERRLNVLITRARARCEVFSNITSFDINLARTNAVGVIALKRFLEYAQNRNKFRVQKSDLDDCSFLDYIYDKLLEYGYKADRNIGVKGFGIDIAVIDSNNPEKYLVGIECDEGVYSNLKSATDRERLRNNVLRNLGWKMYHVWTSDFYRNPKVEFDKLLNFIQLATDSKLEEPVSKEKILVLKRKNIVEIKEDEKFIEYRLYSGPKRRIGILDEVDTLTSLLEKVIQGEAPINTKELKRRVISITNATRLSDNAKVVFEEALKHLDTNKITFRDDFYYLINKDILIRNRSNMDSQIRKIDNICYEEMKLAAFYVVDKGIATALDEIKNEVANALGVNKSNENFVNRINKIIEELLSENKIYLEDDLVFVNDKSLNYEGENARS